MYVNNSKTSQTAGSASLSAPVKKAAYIKPSIKIVEVEAVSHLLGTSFPGQHNPAVPGSGPTPTRAGGGLLLRSRAAGMFEENEEEAEL